MPTGENTILQGKIFEPLLKFTLPLMLTVLIQALYGAVDLMIIGKFGSTAGVAAVANGSQIMQNAIDFITGLSMGVTVLVGRCIGAKDKEGAARAVGGMTWLFVIVALVITALFEIFAKDMAVWMRVPEQAHAQMVTYIRVCSGGIIFSTAFNVISGLFRGIGNSRSPLLFITVACVTNVFGALLLVGVFHLDVLGAAIAAVFAQAVSVAFSLYKIKKDGLPFAVRREHFRKWRSAGSKIWRAGAPVAFQNLLVSISFLVILAMLNNIGLVASASVGIAEKLYIFLALVPISFMYALSAFVAQNMGANQPKRAQQGMAIGMRVAFAFGVAMFAATVFAGDWLAGLFTEDPVVIASTQNYLRGVGGEYLMLPFVFCFLGYFNGIGHTKFVFIEGLVSSFGARVPLCWSFSHLPNTNLFIIGLSVPASSAVSLLMCVLYYFWVRKRIVTQNPAL